MQFNVGFIDDEVDLCDLFAETYAEKDLVIVKTYTQPIEAMNEIRSQPLDLLFIDYRLPGTDGVKLAKALNLQIPVVLLTGEIEVESDYAFYKIIYKPDLEDEIGSTIREIRSQRGG